MIDDRVPTSVDAADYPPADQRGGAIASDVTRAGGWREDPGRRGIIRALAEEGLPLVAIALAVAWLYWRALLEPGTWFPSNGGDLASLIYPNYRFAAESIRAGDLPLWNPYIQSGAPFAADIQSGLLYPINLVVFLLSPRVTYRVVEGLALFHLWLAGALAYAAGRGLRMPPAAALVAGIAYALSDYFVVHVGNLNLIAVAAWLPLVAVAGHRAAFDGGRRWLAVGAFAIAMAALAGHVQPLLYALAVLALICLTHVVQALANRDWPGAARALLMPVATAALGLGSATVQLLPAAELTGLSVRSAISYETSTEYSLAPEQLVSLFVPGFFGRGPDAYWGQWLRTEAGYVGVLTLVLATAAAAAYGTRRARPRPRGDALPALLVVGAGGLLLALGGYTAVHALVYRFVPLFGSLRAPARAIVVFDLAVALSAGLGLAAVLCARDRVDVRALGAALRGWQRVLWAVLILAPAALVMLMLLRENPALPRATGIAEGWIMLAIWLSGSVLLLRAWRHGWIGPVMLGCLAAGWLALDLVTNAQGLELTHQNPETGFDRPAVLEFLARDPQPFRIDTDTGVWDVWQPNTAMVRRVPDVVGGIHPLELSDFRRYWSGLGSRSTPLYDLLNATYLIGKKDVPLDRARFEPVFDADPQLTVFRNRSALPRAFLVAGAVAAPDHDAAYDLIHAGGFDPRAYVVVEGAPALAARGPAGDARLVDYRTSRLTVEVTPNVPGYLVLSEVWYPGWRATVDGRPAPIVRADFLFRAVALQPGDRRVELAFEPTAWRVALVLTALGWLTIAALLLWPRRARLR